MKISKRTLGVVYTKEFADVKVWAPLAKSLKLLVNEKELQLQPADFGYWRLSTDLLQPGTTYQFIVDDNKPLPDPCSLSQPEGVHGPSEVIDLSEYEWTDTRWKNPLLEEYIFYEVHTGCFTQQGTFAAIEEKLDHLISLGITAIELMPVAQFPGTRNWGYDGVFPYAVQNSYGGAKALQHLINTCHQKGLAIVLDVVYNHLGPEGNYLGFYGPYFTDKYKTPWGGALNFDDVYCDGVRDYFIENAMMWLRDFHVDALRIDAVHAIKDFSPIHVLRELKSRVNDLMLETGKSYYLIAEMDLNDPRYINPIEKEGFGLDAQWIDEFHHALRVTAGGEPNGYYSDFNGVEHLAKAYSDAYVYDGQYSPHRKKKFGIKAKNNPGRQFVVFSQNHDQVGNRMLGERTSTLLSFEMQKLLAGAVMVSPFLPMLFMGEEWREPNPFLYFVSHTDPGLAEAVRKGRKEEFAAFHLQGDAPDPMAEETFLRSKLQWKLINNQPHKTMLKYYTTLIHLRKCCKSLSELNRTQLQVEHQKENNTLTLQRWAGDEHIICLMNFSKTRQNIMLPSVAGGWKKIFDSAHPDWLGPEPGPGEIYPGFNHSNELTIQSESILIYTNQ